MANSEACAEFVKQLTCCNNASSSVEGGSFPAAPENNSGGGESFALLHNLLSNPIYQNLSAQQLINFVIGQQQTNNNHNISRKSTAPNNHPNYSAASKMESVQHLDSVVANDDPCLGPSSLLSSPAVDSGRDTPKMSSQFKKSPSQSTAVGDVAADLLEEVTHALTKLQNSLNQGELALDESKRTALLSLVDRLTQGLVSPMKSSGTDVNSAAIDSTDSGVNETMPVSQFELPNTGINMERRGSGGGRFAKRRNRNNRHTVGVTREELADARRIIEELELIGMQNAAAVSSPLPFTKMHQHQPKVTATLLNSNSAGVYNAILTRQISEPVTLLRPSQFLSQESLQDPAKPFKVVLKQSISVDQPSSILKSAYRQQEMRKPATDTEENTRTKEIILQRSSSGLASKFAQRTKPKKMNETDDESEKSLSSSSDDEGGDDDEEGSKTKLSFKSFKARENYLRNQRSLDSSATCNYSSGDESASVRPSKYVSKKMKMRRSNTVNLPKSFSFVNTFEVSDRECSDAESKVNFVPKKLPNQIGLATTYAGNMVQQQPVRPPSFEAKTENDKKFLAFIQKQNKEQVIPVYVNPSGERAAKTANWTNKFGNLKHRFEGDETPLPPKSPAKPPVNAAANFWKSIEKTKPSAKVSPMMSSIQSPPVAPNNAKSFPIVSEKFPWKTEKVVEKIPAPVIGNEEQNVSKKMQMLENSSKLSAEADKAPKVNHEINKLPPSAFVTTNNRNSVVNNFTHAPMSAFKPPISRKLSNSFKPILGNGSDEVVVKKLPQVTNGIVKQIAENGFSQSQNVASVQPRKVTSSPTRNIASVDSAFTRVQPKTEKLDNAAPMPWAGKTKTDRVLSLASAKFEQVPTVHLNKVLAEQPPTIIAPEVKFRANPLYNSTFEKRSSLPPNASFATYEHLTAISHGPPKSDGTFVITDFTSPSSVSTFALDSTPARPTNLDRQDSLTNPEKEPLVLTCDRSSFAPAGAKISNSTSTENLISQDLNEIENDTSVEFCAAAVAKVMKSPVAHSAVVQSSELVSLADINKENLMMKNIHDTLKKFSQKSPTPDLTKKRLSQDSSCSSLDAMKQSCAARLSNDSSHSSIDQALGAIKIPIPAVPETAYSFTYNPSPPKISVKSPSVDPQPQQHVMFNNVSNLQRTRSNYMLNVPQPAEVRPTPSPSVSPVHLSRLSNFFSAQSPIARTPEPAPAPVRSPHVVKRFLANSSLSRSKTMPSIPKKVQLLDESNVEDAFEELLSSANL